MLTVNTRLYRPLRFVIVTLDETIKIFHISENFVFSPVLADETFVSLHDADYRLRNFLIVDHKLPEIEHSLA